MKKKFTKQKEDLFQSKKTFLRLSLVGLNNAAAARNSFRIILWLAIFTTFTVLTLENLWTLYTNLYSTTTTTTYSDQPSLLFPTVSFCNHNRVKCSDFNETMLAYENDTATTEILKTIYELSCKEETQQTEDEDDIPGTILNEYTFLDSYMSLDEPVRIQIGHQFSDFIISCTFGGKDCYSISSFDVLSSAVYGNCFAFNTNMYGNGSQSKTTSLPGPSLGLTVVLNIQQGTYMKNGLSRSAGARIAINDFSVRPSVDDLGVDVQPATSTNFAMEAVNLTSEPAPADSNCYSSWQDTNYSIYSSERDWPYTLTQCRRFCIFDSIMNDCSCFHPLYLDIDANKQEKDPCNMANITVNSCVDKVMTQFTEGSRNCQCSQACNETQYRALLSSSKWPSNQYLDTAKGLFGFNTTNPSSGPSISENLIQVNIYFETLVEKQIVTERTYTGTSLTTGIGGVLSLYLGVPLAMLFELVEIFLDLLANIFNLMAGRPLGRDHMIF